MKKLNMHTPNLTAGNIAKIAELFPSVITEKEGVGGAVEKAVDFDLLRQVLQGDIVEGDDERYRLDWPGKRASLLKANTPITKTLRPDRESSVDFDTTQNLFIEGDNFEVLKILQESYLGKVKMIYIDPPYNTGTAMIYSNDFSKSESEYDEEIGAIDEDGGRLFRNMDSNGRFHSDWLSMIYERILIARDLLTVDGFMTLAIDHNELNNLTSICDEVFGENNRIGVVTVVHKPEGRNQEKFFGTSNEFMLVYAKNKDEANFNDVVLDDSLAELFDSSDERGKFKFKNFIRLSDGKYSLRINKPHFYYPVYVSDDFKEVSLSEKKGFTAVYPITDAGQERTWKTTPETLVDRFNKGDLIFAKDSDGRVQLFEKLRENQVIKTHWIDKKYHGYHFGTKIIDALLGDKTFDFPKSLFLMKDILKMMVSNNDIILDFFAGSATTAHAVMQLNAEDEGVRKFIMVQIPEKTPEDSDAKKAGYETIAEIGKERIRRAGKKILEENKEKLALRTTPLDIGFRVYKTDTTNMKDVYYHPSELKQDLLPTLTDNIKGDRTSEDLLTQIILDLGLELSLPVEKKEVCGNTVYFVQGNALVACFDDAIDFAIVDEIAKIEPLKMVFKDASFKKEQDRTNFETRFKRLSPETVVTVL